MPKYSLAYKISRGMVRDNRNIPKAVCTCTKPWIDRCVWGIDYCLICGLAYDSSSTPSNVSKSGSERSKL